MDWSMGGYAFYVWGSYLFAFAAIGLELFTLLRRKRSSSQLLEDKVNSSPAHHTSAFGTEAR